MHPQHVQDLLRRADEQPTFANSPSGPHTLAEPMALTEDGKAVPRDHEDARFILGGKGKQIPADVAREIGLAGEQPAEQPNEQPNEQPKTAPKAKVTEQPAA